MHERIRVLYPDMENVGFGVFQFRNGDSDERVVRLHMDDGVPLYSFEELDEMVRETYAIWDEVLNEREVEARRRASGTRGSLL